MTSPVDTSVKYFHSAMPGAPVLSGTVGAMLAILDACLINGFGLQTLDSLVITANVAVATKAGHSAEVGSVMLVAGATPSALNGEQKVTAVTANTYSFATTGISDQTATGTITAKLAPAGWAKTFTGTNLAVYKPTDVTATGCLLRVDDTVARTSRVVGYETMADVNTGTGPFPVAAQVSGGLWWSKSGSADATARNWMLATDGKLFYMMRENFVTATNNYETTCFGDPVPQRSGDAFSCTITGPITDYSGASPVSVNNLWAGDGSVFANMYCPRSYTGLGSAIRLRKAWSLPYTAVGLGSGNGALPYPNPADGGIYVGPMHTLEDASLSLRGVLPGLWGSPQSIPITDLKPRDSITGVTGLTGRTLRVSCGSTATAVTNGVVFIDTTGPWR